MKELTDFAGDVIGNVLKINGTPAEQSVKDALAAGVDAGIKIFNAVQAVLAQRKTPAAAK